MRNLYVLCLLFCNVLAVCQVSAQNVFNNGLFTLSNSDNSGGTYQPGSEVLNSTLGAGVAFEVGSTFEHVGQFYVAKDGIWNQNNKVESTDYFGYAPLGIGSYVPYQGVGIKGASSNNGGSGAGRPSFYNIELNNTGYFPLEAGMYIAHSLTFNNNGPGGKNIIGTPTANRNNFLDNSVIFSPTASVSGANADNYINGFASVIDPVNVFTLPLGDSNDIDNPFHQLTINSPISGTVTARYLYTLQHSGEALGEGVKWVSPFGDWPISAPAGTNVTVSMPPINILPDQASYLRLVGWNGHQWIDLSKNVTPSTCVTGNCQLTGTLTANITDLAIGMCRNPSNEITLTVWPNPSQGILHVRIPDNKIVSKVNVFTQQGKLIRNSPKSEVDSGFDVSELPTGSYIIEVHTTEGHILRQHFIHQ